MDRHSMELFEARMAIEQVDEWSKWAEEVPYISLPSHLEMRVVPPLTGAIVRFLVRSKSDKDTRTSIYLDCYDKLGVFGEPYWEVYPYEGDVFRCKMNNTEALINAIVESVDSQTI